MCYNKAIKIIDRSINKRFVIENKFFEVKKLLYIFIVNLPRRGAVLRRGRPTHCFFFGNVISRSI